VPTSSTDITPVSFVPPGIPGFSFPIDQVTIDTWTADVNGAGGDAIALHAWGIWTGLTSYTDQQYNGQTLRTYETWETPGNLACPTPADCPKTPRPLSSPGQLPDNVNALAVTVSYDPTAADYVLENSLIAKDKLTALQGSAPNIGRIVLPNTSISLKPTYTVLSSASQYALLKTWPGPPSPAKAWPNTDWPTCVWVDLQDTTVAYGPFTPATNTVAEKVCQGDVPSGPSHIVPLGAFIHFNLDAEEAGLATSASGKTTVAGDIALLLAMHVTTRESKQDMTRWTWQTFWWSTDAAEPHAPSTATMVTQIPAQLKTDNHQAANYAGCAAYQMLDPVQPMTGGNPAGGKPIYCYSPWLEAPFNSADDLPFSANLPPWTYDDVEYQPLVGVQSNCMSCHLHAAWKNGPYAQSPTPTNGGAALCDNKGCYDAAHYIDMNADYFQGSIVTDALWSIPDSVP
jgi:hypothetical protein